MNSQNSIDKNILDLKVERPDFAVILEGSRKKKKFTDVQLQIGDQLFDAHRVILAAYSPVLEAAVSEQWSTTKICPISAEYVDSEIMDDLLGFLYTGSIKLTPDNVHPVCVAAHFLQIPSLLEPSVKHLCRLISVENALSLFEFGFTCQLEQLRFPCLRVIQRNYEKVFQDPQILKFSSEIFIDLISGLKDQYRPETMLKENTFDCIVRWTEVNLSERLEELPGLLKNIPLEDLPSKFLTKTVSKHRLVKESISCIEDVSRALSFEIPKDQNMIVIGIDKQTELQSISCYDFRTKVWRKLPNMLQRRSYFGVTVINRKDIVVAGGVSHSTYDEMLNTVEMFDWASQSWKQLPDLPDPTHWCSMASLNGHLYALELVGWLDTSGELLRYSFETGKWQYVKSMEIEQTFAKLVECDGYLYVFGQDTSTVQRYDPALDEWTIIEDSQNAPSSTNVLTATVHKNKIFTRGTKSFEEFDPETYARIQHPKELKVWGNLASVNGRLLDVRANNKSIYKYTSITKKWTKFCEMNSELREGVIVAGAFY